jgi:hypothetical protein
MRVASPETSRWAAELGARLRLLQSSFADDLPETRGQILKEELAQALKAVPVGRRKDHLEALGEQFAARAFLETSRSSGGRPAGGSRRSGGAARTFAGSAPGQRPRRIRGSREEDSRFRLVPSGARRRELLKD